MTESDPRPTIEFELGDKHDATPMDIKRWNDYVKASKAWDAAHGTVIPQ